MSEPQAPTVILTDVRPTRTTDTRCPQCRAPEKERHLCAPFGRVPYQVCSQCGYEFPRES